jgi:hypothetical protein
MAEVALSEEQKDVVRRYVQTWRRWRQGIRGFAQLEDDLAKRCAVLVDGITVDSRPGRAVISSDDKDTRFYAAIFDKDDEAVADMTPDELVQARRYIIRGEGTMPVRKWRELKRNLGGGLIDREAVPGPARSPAATTS